MSVEAVNWAFSVSGICSSAKFVLVAMANRTARGGNLCYPSVADLISQTSQDRKTVLRNTQRLQEAGLILDTGERKGRTGQVIVYALNSPDFGTVEQAQKRDRSPGERVPKTDGKSPAFPSEGSHFSAETGPKTGHGTQVNPSERKGTSHTGGATSSASRPDGRGGELPAYISVDSWGRLLRSRKQASSDDIARWLLQAENLHNAGQDVGASITALTTHVHWRELSATAAPAKSKSSRQSGFAQKFNNLEKRNGCKAA